MAEISEIPIYRPRIKWLGAKLRGRAARRKATALSALNIVAEELPYSAQVLYRFLDFRINTAKIAARRSSWAGGRLFNLLSGQSPHFVPLYGTHLRQVLSYAGYGVPAGIEPKAEYELRLDYAQKARDVILAEIEPK